MEYNYTDQFLRGLVEFIEWAKWLLLLAFCLTMGDLKFGIASARYRGEAIKRSRAVRRTVDKICSYIIWLLMAYTFGQAFGKPFGIDLIPLMILLIIYGVELESIFANYFAARGRKIKINILGFFAKKVEIIEIEKTEENNENN